jgi:hypothetical protein
VVTPEREKLPVLGAIEVSPLGLIEQQLSILQRDIGNGVLSQRQCYWAIFDTLFAAVFVSRVAPFMGRDGAPCGLHRGVWVVDFSSRQAYKVSVMAS